MVSRYAVVAGGVVTNIVKAEADVAAEKGWIAATAGVAPGWAYAGGNFTAPAVPIQKVKAALWEKARARRDRKIDAGVAVPGIGTFDTDLNSRINILGAVVAATIANQLSQPFEIGFKLADNSIVDLDGPQMIAVGMAVFEGVAAIHATAQTIGQAIEAAGDVAELAAVDIDALGEGL